MKLAPKENIEQLRQSHILVVDDEPGIRENLEMTLTRHGFEISTAETGPDGLSQIQDRKPDLVLLDVMLPGISGHMVCNRVKASKDLRDIPIIMLTALGATEDEVKGLEAGADDYIGKPFKEEELIARIKSHLRTKHLHDKLEKSYQDLKEMQALKDNLSRLIVHDLKAPLTAVKGGIEVALDMAINKNSAIDPQIKKLLENSFNGSRRVLELVEDILEISRLEDNRFPIQKKVVNIKDLIQSCLSFLEAEGKKYQIIFSKNIDPSLSKVLLDENLIKRTLTNLLSNSLKFTPPEGKISISVQKNQTDGSILFSVEDTGPGIPKDMIDKIFDKFFQGNDETVTRKGQGLGLTFCKLAVKAHQGQIWAESKEKEGSTFLFQIPQDKA